MDGYDTLAGPPLPEWFLFPSTAIFSLIVFYVAAKTKGRAARFLILACWFRYTLSSLQEYTYRPAFGTLSFIAVGSIVTIVTGLLVLEKRRFFKGALALPIAAVCGSIVLSGIVNQMPGAIMEPVLRFMFFAVICVAVWQALENKGAVILRRLLVVFIAPIADQVASVALGVVKSGEIDGSISYIGGFFHEQIFSLVMATCFLVTILASRIGRFQRLALCTISLAGIYLANYRTTIVAMVPLTMVAIFMGFPRTFRTKQRALVVIVVVTIGLGVMAFGTTAAQERFSDLDVVATQGTHLIKPPEQFRSAERRVLSARPYIWSWYIYAYAKAPKTQRIVGLGPDAWVGQFDEYAHNTLISFLYEMGLIGAAAILFLWLMMFRLALAAEPHLRPLLLSAHLSFFLLNMATMPFSQLEGDILYGMLCGYTLAKARFAKARGAIEMARLRRTGAYAQPGFARAAPMRVR